MRTTTAAWLATLATVGTPALGHHSLYGVYERSEDTSLEGTVTEFRFVNPHPVLVIEIGREDGSRESWELEMDNRRELAGIGITASSFPPGDRVLVRGSVALTRERAMYLWRLDRPADEFWYEQRGSTPYAGRGSGGSPPQRRRRSAQTLQAASARCRAPIKAATIPGQSLTMSAQRSDTF
jgi:Family of unknown function (DUF6152)